MGIVNCRFGGERFVIEHVTTLTRKHISVSDNRSSFTLIYRNWFFPLALTKRAANNAIRGKPKEKNGEKSFTLRINCIDVRCGEQTDLTTSSIRNRNPVTEGEKRTREQLSSFTHSSLAIFIYFLLIIFVSPSSLLFALSLSLSPRSIHSKIYCFREGI